MEFSFRYKQTFKVWSQTGADSAHICLESFSKSSKKVILLQTFIILILIIV